MSSSFGAIAEMTFILEVMKKGLIPSRPCFEGCAYDLIVDNGKNRHRIQVKSTFSKGPVYKMEAIRSNDMSKPYTPDDCDYIVFYVDNIKSFYIIPIEDMKEVRKLSLTPGSIKSKWNKYREVWNILLA